jgi:hypothetical protein
VVAGYVHVEVETAQSPKRPDWPCGDVVGCDRSEAATTIVCADGIGSGVHAHIAATLCTSRLLESLRLGRSLRQATASLVQSMERNREPKSTFAAFTVVRILNDGMATILAYEAPSSILISRRHAVVIPSRSIELGGAIVTEAECCLEPNDALLIMSDGITQAGLGYGLAQGWQTDGVLRFVNHALGEGRTMKEIADVVHREARRLWIDGGDDCTALMATCRRGVILNILTGPPASSMFDVATVRRFMQSEGLKVVCGGTTAAIVGRVLRKAVVMESSPTSMIAPPKLEIPGVDLVTEGAVTLNQVYNVLSEDMSRFTESSGVTELCGLLQVADRVNIISGEAKNQASDDISLRQCGILTRDHIVPLLAQKLLAAGKLVVVERI